MTKKELIKIALDFNSGLVTDIDYIFMSMHGHVFIVGKNGLDAHIHASESQTPETILITSEDLIKYYQND